MIENQEQNPKFKNPKRDKTISIKVTNKELTKIYLYASEKPHTSISEYIRDKALKQAKRPVEITEEDYQKLEKFILQTKENKKVVETNETNKELPSDRLIIGRKELDAINELVNLYDDKGNINLREFNNNKQHFINIKRAFNDLITSFKNN